jgi:hypothetical protein
VLLGDRPPSDVGEIPVVGLTDDRIDGGQLLVARQRHDIAAESIGDPKRR